MSLGTIEEDYEYRMRNIIKKMVKDYSLKDLTSEELQDKLWSDYPEQFARTVLEDMYEFGGDEIFDLG